MNFISIPIILGVTFKSFNINSQNRESRSPDHFLVCAKGYAFWSGRVKEQIHCVNGEWIFPTTYNTGEFDTCQPVCREPCLNNGVCIGPDTCSCPSPFTGISCEILDEELCWEEPDDIKNARFWYR